MRKFINNERGSGLFYTMFYMMIFGIAVILILNIAIVFMKKGQANVAAEQASYAATSVIYKKVFPIAKAHIKIIEVKDEDGNIIEVIKEPLIEKFDIIKDSILNANKNLTDNEAEIQALNEVLVQEIPADDDLSCKIAGALNNVNHSISYAVQTTIENNGGKFYPGEYQWSFNKQNRIEVDAKAEFKAVHYNGINFGSDDDIPQTGEGPTIPFYKLPSMGACEKD